MKKVSIVFTRLSDPLSQLVYYTTGCGYTHAAIGVEDDELFSFTLKGFSRENLAKYKRHGVTQSARCSFRVSEQEYQMLRQMLDDSMLHQQELRYTFIGLMFCFLRIPFKWKKHYFCSQYVAELLHDSGVVKLDKPASLFFPNHLYKALSAHAELESLVLNPVAV